MVNDDHVIPLFSKGGVSAEAQERIPPKKVFYFIQIRFQIDHPHLLPIQEKVFQQHMMNIEQ